MAVVTSTVLAIASIAVAAVGAGMSYYGQQQQAKNSERMAAYNAAVQQQQSDLQARMAQRQAMMNQQSIQTEVNQVDAVDNQAVAVVDTAQEDIRRNRENQLRMMASQRATYAKAGVLMAGSPVAMLAETAGIFELQNQDVQHKADLENRSLTRQAELQRYGYGNDAYVQQLNYQAAGMSKKIGMDQANITRMQGASTAQGYRMASYGTLLSGAGGAISGVSSAYAQSSQRTQAIG